MGKRGRLGLERKQEKAKLKPRENKANQEKEARKIKSKAIFRYFLAYLGLLSYFEDMIMNL